MIYVTHGSKRKQNQSRYFKWANSFVPPVAQEQGSRTGGGEVTPRPAVREALPSPNCSTWGCAGKPEAEGGPLAPE